MYTITKFESNQVIRLDFHNRKSTTDIKYHSNYLNLMRVQIHMRSFPSLKLVRNASILTIRSLVRDFHQSILVYLPNSFLNLAINGLAVIYTTLQSRLTRYIKRR